MIGENLNNLKSKIEKICFNCGRNPSEIKIVPATKTVPPQIISSLIQYEIFDIGENRVQELIQKLPNVDERMNWHFIGTLQTNKVKYIIDKVKLIHSLDRVALADEIEKQASRRNITIDTLIEINAGDESAKSGVNIDVIDKLYEHVLDKKHIRLKGFMAVFPINAHEKLYERVHQVFDRYKNINPNIEILSMGMSNDYETAIKHGATLIRPGSIIFGRREIVFSIK